MINREEENHHKLLAKDDQYTEMEVFEVTQLINSFLGLIVLPNETFKDWKTKEYSENRRELRRNQAIKTIETNVQNLLNACRDGDDTKRRYVNSYEDPDKHVNIFWFCHHLRNSVAHNGVHFLTEGKQITHIIFYDSNYYNPNKGKKKQEFCLKLDIKEGEVAKLAGYIAELYRHIEEIEIRDGQNGEYEKWVEKLNCLLQEDKTADEGTVAEQMEIFKKEKEEQRKQEEQRKKQNTSN